VRTNRAIRARAGLALLAEASGSDGPRGIKKQPSRPGHQLSGHACLDRGIGTDKVAVTITGAAQRKTPGSCHHWLHKGKDHVLASSSHRVPDDRGIT